MSELISNVSLVSTCDDNVENNSFAVENEIETKIKRTFSLKRNYSYNKINKRKNKYKDGMSDTSGEADERPIKRLSILKPTSWNKLIHKMMHKMTNLGVSTRTYTGYDCNDGQGFLSLSSNDIYNNDVARYSSNRPTFVIGDKVPGVIGLRNHGNTCFINSVLQCLCHTDVLAEYFVLDQYKIDLSRRNKLNSKKYGTKGEVTEQLAILLKSIWSCQYKPEISNQFKLVVDKYGSQYRGNNQHDAQEFLLWLLDKVHEDLNTATKKKYKTIKNSFGRPDVVAAETLANHVRCNNSFVHAVFQAQFCSSVTCPRCDRQSNTFDPFLCVSVPVPQNHIGIYVTVLYTAQQPRQVKLGILLPVNDEIKEMKKLLSSYTGIAEKNILITEITNDGFQRTFSDNTPVNTIKETDCIYCLELPQNNNQLDDDTNLSEAYLLLCWVNLLVVENQMTRFGSPFTMPICRETSYVDLQKLILKEMAWMLHDDVLTSEQEVPLFRIRVADTADTPEMSYLDHTVDHPLFTEPVEHALALGIINNVGPPQHLKLVLEWNLQTKQSIIADDTDQIEEHSSVKQLKLTTEQGMSVTLEECFNLYTQAEVLGPEDAWHCPNCNLKQEVVKQLGLWTLPDILVVHMKRFRQTSGKLQHCSRSPIKLTTLVDFPLYGFDMSSHLAPGYRGSSPQSLWSPWRRHPSYKHSLRKENNTYDLYAICNHHGQDLQNGHYTAYCRNPYDAQWYCFDDARVVPISESSLVTPAAYILFYQRRGLISSSSSSTESGCEHWSSRLSIVKHARSSEEITRNNNKKGNNNDFSVRGNRAYGTLQPVSKQNVARAEIVTVDINKETIPENTSNSSSNLSNGISNDTSEESEKNI